MNDDELGLMMPVYQADRQDLQALNTVNGALFGAASAYVGLVVFALTQAASDGIPVIVVLFLPLPLWSLVTFAVLIANVAVLKSSACKEFEALLTKRLRLSMKDSLGVTLQARIDAPTKARKLNAPSQAGGVFLILLWTCYATMGFVICGFTAWVVLGADCSLSWRIVALACYLGMAVLSLWSLVSSVGSPAMTVDYSQEPNAPA
ncbi:hypothetical protein F1D05_16750 [Kribbella qitaiheensis]|uniref:Uncharacterized protein n=1 Tax=Kribbella qitaiheensis TaxID=1544730 RepID=A0A7G6WZ47_9ACTN|nr:hypothetical protein [Kribbella qitaiheensis]QNE19262.1 hypothetical protein F1D05_16750 [Kribbella qitaiheensis]